MKTHNCHRCGGIGYSSRYLDDQAISETCHLCSGRGWLTDRQLLDDFKPRSTPEEATEMAVRAIHNFITRKI